MGRRMRALLVFAVLALALIAAAAAVEGVGAIPAPPAPSWPQAPAVPASARAALAGEPLRLAADAETRHVEKLTLRIRNISCGQAAIGSGFALDANTLITNRHVIAGAAALQADTWDGQTIDLDVSQASTGLLVDVGVIHAAQALPVIAKTGPEPPVGAPITAVGYPLGGALTITHGRVLAYLDGNSLPAEIAFDGRVMEVSAPVKHGNSGGPLLDARGRVVGVVFAAQPGVTYTASSGITLVLPLSSINALLQQGGGAAVQPCGS
jgi:S1-C subfamily serine protease